LDITQEKSKFLTYLLLNIFFIPLFAKTFLLFKREINLPYSTTIPLV